MTTLNRRSFLTGAAALGAAAATGGLVWKPRRAASQATPVPSNSALLDLRQRLAGTLMLPEDSGYLAASAPANGRYLDIRPAAVARCADEADVVTCVNWCNENGIKPVGRGGGHSYAGLSTTTGLMLDLRRLNSVAIDRQQTTLTCGGAATNGDYFTAAEDGPLLLPGGTCLGVGMGGLTLGGGIGYNAHWAGLTSDHLLASRIVTANGDVLEIDASQHPDLYWACRGGAGGNFGINTSLTFSMVEVPAQDVAFYRFTWRGADAAAAVFSAFHAMLETAPPALNAVAMAQAAPVGDGGPREAIDVMSRGQYIGPVDELRDLVQPLLDAASPVTQTLNGQTFWSIQRYIATGEPDPHSFGDISRYADKPLPDDAVAKVVDLLAECPSRTADANGSFWSLGWVGGVVNDLGRTDTAYVHRDMLTLLRPTTVWPNDADASVGEGLNAWSAEVIAAIAPHTPNESYQNFPNRDITDWAEQYYAENYDKLVEVKTQYDPGNLFTNPQGIPPRVV
ncbi:MAG: FAD-binding oxidoreductase [Thermomicrobiales bacterium]